MSRPFGFWVITFLGGILLLDIAVHLSRAPSGFAGLDYFEWGMNAVLVVVIWVSCRRQLRDLDKLAGQVEQKVMVRMSGNAYGMAFVAYLFLLQQLTHLHRH